MWIFECTSDFAIVSFCDQRVITIISVLAVNWLFYENLEISKNKKTNHKFQFKTFLTHHISIFQFWSFAFLIQAFGPPLDPNF